MPELEPWHLAVLCMFFLPTIIAVLIGRPVWRILGLNLLVAIAVFAWPAVLLAALFDKGE